MLCFGGFFIYAGNYYHAKDYDTDDNCLKAELSDCIIYGNPAGSTAFIFYPGAKVEPQSYEPLMEKIAQAVGCSIIVKMPYNFAFFDINAADDLIMRFPMIKHWYIGGHSLGGSMAAYYADKHEADIDGLILLASYSTKEITIPTLSIYGDNDKELSSKAYASNRPNLLQLDEHILLGGNHAGFGNYGAQKGDGVATITQAEQWHETAAIIQDFINSISCMDTH